MDNFVRGDTSSALQVTCFDNATSKPMNLSNSTVSIEWVTNKDVYNTRDMTIIDKIKGVVLYQFQENELESPEMDFSVVIKTNGKQVTSKQSITIIVRERV